MAEPLDYVLSLAEAGLAEMRALIFELRPESLETEGLVAALEKQAAALRARHGIAVDAELCDEPDVPLEVKEALYRIAQEALHNTVKHARASRVDLRLTCDAGSHHARGPRRRRRLRPGRRRSPATSACARCASGPRRWAGAWRSSPARGRHPHPRAAPLPSADVAGEPGAASTPLD